MNRLARLLHGDMPLRRVFLRLAEAFNARLGRRAQGRLYFEDVYRVHDPWDYEGSAYERAKYERTLDMLPQPRFRRALEAGCSIGVFTAMLATRADEVVGIDISARACRHARARCRHAGRVRIARADLAHFADKAGFDLIVCAEMLYYLWDRPVDREATCRRLGELLRPGGWLVFVFGGSGVGQDWEGAMERSAGLLKAETRFFDDPVRPWRLSILRKPVGR